MFSFKNRILSYFSIFRKYINMDMYYYSNIFRPNDQDSNLRVGFTNKQSRLNLKFI